MLQNETFKAIFNHCDSAIFEPRKNQGAKRLEEKQKNSWIIQSVSHSKHTHALKSLTNGEQTPFRAKPSFFLPGHRKAFALRALETKQSMPTRVNKFEKFYQVIQNISM